MNKQNSYNIEREIFKKRLDEILPFDKNNIMFPYINKCKYILYDIKYNNKNINDIQYDLLALLTFVIIFYYSKNKKDICEIFKQQLQYDKIIKEFSDLVIRKEQRLCVYSYIKNKNGNNELFKNIMLKKQCKLIDIDFINKYKKIIEEMKVTALNNCKILIDILNMDNNTDNTIFIRVLETYLEKVDKYYKYINKFNKPELDIYNYVINQLVLYPQILQLFTNIRIPISRNNKHDLRADILIVFHINNDIKFGIIEYDGPTHYNINDFRFSENIILCDKEKNNFCINNNISLLRLHYKQSQQNIFTQINTFIKNIIETNKPTYYGIPTNDFYDGLLNSYYQNNFNK